MYLRSEEVQYLYHPFRLTCLSLIRILFILYNKKGQAFACPHFLLGGEGFEPSKLSQQIYSLPPLAARESTHMQLKNAL